MLNTFLTIWIFYYITAGFICAVVAKLAYCLNAEEVKNHTAKDMWIRIILAFFIGWYALPMALFAVLTKER
jgi:hypothetical protein